MVERPESAHSKFLSAFMFTWAVFYPEKKPDKLMITGYWEALKTFAADAIVDAFKRSIIELRWFPRPAELIGFIKPKEPQIESRAEQQVALVLSMVRTHGYMREPVWEDPVTASLFRGRFQWRSLCDTLTEDETKWFVKEFKAAYDAAVDSGAPLLLESSAKVKELVAPVIESFTVLHSSRRYTGIAGIRDEMKKRQVEKRNIRKFTPEEIAEHKRILLEDAK